MTIAARINERSIDALKWARIRSEAIARKNPDDVTLAEEAIARIADVVIGELSQVRPEFDATGLPPAIVRKLDAASRRKWLHVMPTGERFYVNTEATAIARYKRFGGEVYAPTAKGE